MAKWFATRKYKWDYHCSVCGNHACNPSVVYLRYVGPCGCPTVGCSGVAMCDVCNTPIAPYRQHSGKASINTTAGQAWLWNAECDPACTNPDALGIVPVHRVTFRNPITSLTPVPPVALPGAADPYLSSKAKDRQDLSIKLVERIKQAIGIASAQGHNVSTMVVVDLDNDSDIKRVCDTCGGQATISMKRFADPPFTGTALAFPCATLKRKS